MRNGSSARRRHAVIAAVQPLGAGLGRIDLCGEGVGAGVEAGHFAMVEAPGRPDCVLARPLSYFRVASRDEVSFLVKEVGKGTRELLASRTGTPLALLGPLGRPFPAPQPPCWLVAGGVGAAFCGGLAGRPGIEILFGARTASQAGFAAALEALGARVTLCTDDGSAGSSGTVADLLAAKLARGRPTAIYSCGPTAMMAAVARVAAAHGVPCWVSLEERMGCGFGVCRGCAHRDASGGWRCICEDGPVYRAEEIFGADGSEHGG